MRLQFESLTYMDFSSCQEIEMLPDLSMATPNLKCLLSRQCKSLDEVHESVGCLDKLIAWDLEGCTKLRSLPRLLKMKSLLYLCLFNCSSLENFPEISQEMGSLVFLDVNKTVITKLPQSFGNLTRLEQLLLGSKDQLVHLPISIYDLQNLCELTIYGSAEFPRAVRTDRQLQCNSYGGLSKDGFWRLNKLSLHGFSIPSELDFVLTSCCTLSLKQLYVYIYIYPSNVAILPESIIRFDRLHTLCIKGCAELVKIPRLPHSITKVDASSCFLLDSQSSRKLLIQVSLSLSLIKIYKKF